MTDREDDDDSELDVDWLGNSIYLVFLCAVFVVTGLIFEGDGWLYWITFAALWIPIAHWVLPRVRAWVHQWWTKRRDSTTE